MIKIKIEAKIDDEKLAHHLAKSIFEVGADPGSPCTRIEFKGNGGEFKGNGGVSSGFDFNPERSQGGYCLEALRDHIQRELKKFWNLK